VLHDEALDVADGQRLVVVGADAGVLAKVVADPTQNRGKRIVLAGETHRPREVAVADRVHVLRDLLVHRALVDAGSLDAVEKIERPRGLRPIGPEGALLVPPFGSRLGGVLTQVDSGEDLERPIHEHIAPILGEAALERPGANGIDDSTFVGRGTEALSQLGACRGAQCQSRVGEHRVAQHRRKLGKLGLADRRFGDEIVKVERAHVVHGGLESFEVLEHAQVAAGFQQIGANGDADDARSKEIGDIETVGASGEGDEKIATELLRQRQGQVGRHRVEGPARQIHHLVAIEYIAKVLDFKGVGELHPEDQVLLSCQSAQVVKHGHRIDIEEVMPEGLVGNGNVAEAQLVVDDASDPVGAEQGRIAFDAGVEPALFQQVGADLLDLVGWASVHGG
jgi:hypothetical protein